MIIIVPLQYKNNIMEEKVIITKKLLDEVLGALVATSMVVVGGKNAYIDDLVEKVEKDIKPYE